MRRSGKTTRAVDRFVQELFEKGETFIYEGRGEISERQQTRYAFERFQERMHNEHRSFEYKHKFLKIDGIDCYKVTKK